MSIPGTDSTAWNNPRKTLDLAFHVLLAALDDEVQGVAAGDDVLRRVTRRAQHTHGVVMRQHDIANRLGR